MRTIRQIALAIFGVSCAFVWMTGQSAPLPGTRAGDWTHYTADVRGSRYAPLDQIDAANFNKLEVAWHFKTDNLGPRPEYKLEGTPLAIRGMVYTTGGTRRSVVALDGATGEIRWVYGLTEGKRAAAAPRQLSGRGLSYWTDGKEERVLYVTPGYRLVSLDARTGQPVASFGTNGVVDLKVGALIGRGHDQVQIDLESGEIGLHSTPTVTGDIVIVGSAFKEGLAVSSPTNTKGLVRAFDVRTGRQLWRFNTMPGPGEYGHDTWENGSWDYTGNTGVWTQITVDEEAGIVYLPVETPTSDLYGGHRPGNNLFAESLVAVDLKTGQRKWHFQFVHHPTWDMDMSSAPLLADVVIDGRPRKVVAVPSKQSFVYVFDRITGEPIWPITEVPVPQSTVPGEKSSPTQPIPTRPPAYARNVIRVPDDIIDFTPALRSKALEQLKWYVLNPTPYNPPVVSNLKGPLAALTVGSLGGGTNWPGASYDPELHTVFAQACSACIDELGLVKPPRDLSTLDYVWGSANRKVELSTPIDPGAPPGGAPQAPAVQASQGESPASSQPQPPKDGTMVDGLLIVKPPYGVLSAINLDRGELVWQVPHGETPDNVRNHPQLRGLTLPRTGQPESVGVAVTRSLVVAGDGQTTSPPGRPRGAMLRAYDKTTGKEVGAVWMPAPQSGSPMTYMANGKQYIIVATSGGISSGDYIAFALPDSELRTRSQE